jgi:hypothetical protein
VKITLQHNTNEYATHGSGGYSHPLFTCDVAEVWRVLDLEQLIEEALSYDSPSAHHLFYLQLELYLETMVEVYPCMSSIWVMEGVERRLQKSTKVSTMSS